MNSFLKRVPTFLSEEKTASRVAIAVFIVLIAILAFGQVSYNDFWWHLAVGKEMFATHSFLQYEIFSYAFQGKLWMNATWIFDGLLYYIYTHGSFLGLNMLRFCIFASAYWALITAARLKNKTPYPFAIAIFIFTLSSLRNFLRPEITSPLFLGLTLYGLFAFKYRRSKLIYLLPLLEVVWVNTHGSFQMGIILAGIFLGSEMLRSLLQHRHSILPVLKNSALRVYALITVLMALATLVNPLGIRIYAFVYAMLRDKDTLANISEWQPFVFKNLLNLSNVWLFPLILLTWLCIVVFIRKLYSLWKKYPKVLSFGQHLFFEDIFIILFFLISLMQYNRILYLFAIILAFIIVRNGKLLFKNSKHLEIAGLLLLPLAVLSAIHINPWAQRLTIGPTEVEQPKESISFLQTSHLQGHMLNEYADGGQLIWKLYPQYQIYIDGRAANVYTSQFYWEYLNLTNKNVFNTIIDKNDIQFAILPISSNLHSLLASKDDWSLAFFDNFSSVFVRTQDIPTTTLSKGAYTILDPSKDASFYVEQCSNAEKKNTILNELSRNIHELEHPAYSLSILAKMLTECPGRTPEDLQKAHAATAQALEYRPTDAMLWYGLGSIQLLEGEDAAALKSFEKSLKLTKTKQSLTGLGVALHNLEKYKAASKVFSKVITTPGSIPPEYYQIYGRTEYQLANSERAIDLFQRYIEVIDPKLLTPQAYLDLSYAFDDIGNPEQASYYANLAKNFPHATSTVITPLQ